MPLAKDEKEKIEGMASRLAAADIDVVYTSPLVRNLASVLAVFEKRGDYPIFRHFGGRMEKWAHFFGEEGKGYVPVYVTEALNERYYGTLQGLNKEETMEKYGEEQVRLWRRSYREAPPGGESLEEVVKRVVPFWRTYGEKDLKNRKNVLVVASHNSLRALVKYIENIGDDDIIKVEVPYGGLLEYEFSGREYKKLKT